MTLKAGRIALCGLKPKSRFLLEATPTEGITRALHAEVVDEPELKANSMSIEQPFASAIKTGQTFKISFWARSQQSNTVAVMIETSAQPHKSLVYKRIALTPDWKQYDVKTDAKEDVGAGDASVNFHFGLKPGTIELTGVQGASKIAAPCAINHLNFSAPNSFLAPQLFL